MAVARDVSSVPEPFRRSRRNFIVIAHRALTNEGINLKDLCGASGRWDGVARSITSSLFLSHDIRRDTSIHILLLGPPDPPKILTIEGSSVKYLNPDERACAALMRKNLSFELSGSTGTSIRTSPGIYQTRGDLEYLLSVIRGTIALLDEGGSDLFLEDNINELASEDKRIFFILSDDQDLREDEREALERSCMMKISVGPLSLHTNQAITIVHNAIDRYSP